MKLAYETLSFQGYSPEDIYLISTKTISGVTQNVVTLSRDNLKYAITQWAAKNVQDAVIYIIGKGDKEIFHLNETETMNSRELSIWLDELQEQMPGILTVIYDADHSGSFLPALAAPEGKQRIVISGTDVERKAVFLYSGNISFSNFFWREVMNGTNIADSFLKASESVDYSSSSDKRYISQLDDNGNGIGNEDTDSATAFHYYIGAGIRLAGDAPVIGSVSPDVNIGAGSSAAVRAENVTTTHAIDKVIAVIVPPESNDTLTETIQVVELILQNDGRYETVYDQFISDGIYLLAIYAVDSDGNVSAPKMTRITHRSYAPDEYEEDDSAEQAGYIVINSKEAQHRNFHDAGDEDWIRFYAVSGKTYTLKTKDTGRKSNTVIELFDEQLNYLIYQNKPFARPDERLDWYCPANGYYYVKISHADSSMFGEGTEYDFEISTPTGSGVGEIRCTVKDAVSGNPIDKAEISLWVNDELQSKGFSLPDGSYLVVQEAGIVTVSVEAEGCQKQTFPQITVIEGEATQLDILLTPVSKDTDRDSILDVSDNCPDISNTDQKDTDGDGVGDICDNCISHENNNQTDTDGDNAGDVCDGCPSDPEKTAPGECGCNVRETDADRNGTTDCLDEKNEENSSSDGGGGGGCFITAIFIYADLK